MEKIVRIEKENYDESLHKDWYYFRGQYFQNKQQILKYLAASRLYSDAPTKLTHPSLYEKNPGLPHYMGNPNIKAAYSETQYTQEQLDEYRKCFEDPVYFIETYVYLNNVDMGAIPLSLYDFQRRMINDFHNFRFNICKLPRQCGKSATSVAYILWYVLFNPGKTVGILANKGDLAKEMLGRLQMAYETLPFWLQQGAMSFNKTSMYLENKSKIIATTSSSSAARGHSFSLIFLDEFAFVEPNKAKAFFESVYPTISSGSKTKMIIVSTPKGMNHFYKMWEEAVNSRSSFNPIEINWWDVPGRDEEWKENEIANSSEDTFRQEFECQFIGSSSTLISPTKLSSISCIKPVKTEQDIDYYEEVKQGHQYLITVDCAKGMRMDYSAFVVVDVTNMPYKIVAKYRSNIVTPLIYPQFISSIGCYYNNAWVLVETNDVGGQVVLQLANELEYPNILTTVSKGRAGFQLGTGTNEKLGVTTSTAVKAKGCSNFKSLIESDKLIIEDYDIYEEITTFVRKNESVASSFSAEPGCTDDLVMCLVLFSWAVNSEYWRELTNLNISKSIYRDKLKEEKENEHMINGFYSLNHMNDKTIDQNGDIWSSNVDQENELPDWYRNIVSEHNRFYNDW